MLGFLFGGGDGLLVDDGVAHVPHMLLGLVQHIEDLLLVDSAGLVGCITWSRSRSGIWLE